MANLVKYALKAKPELAERIGTVDKFQRQEVPVVVYSMTSSSPEDAPRGMEFLYNPNRFNVATSRARALRVLVGSPLLLDPMCNTPRQIRWRMGFVGVGKGRAWWSERRERIRSRLL
ncbi:MAG: AAA domain-containing protein [Pseudomonadales bacterium]